MPFENPGRAVHWVRPVAYSQKRQAPKSQPTIAAKVYSVMPRGRVRLNLRHLSLVNVSPAKLPTTEKNNTDCKRFRAGSKCHSEKVRGFRSLRRRNLKEKKRKEKNNEKKIK
jgi:hypothetical protein